MKLKLLANRPISLELSADFDRAVKFFWRTRSAVASNSSSGAKTLRRITLSIMKVRAMAPASVMSKQTFKSVKRQDKLSSNAKTKRSTSSTKPGTFSRNALLAASESMLSKACGDTSSENRLCTSSYSSRIWFLASSGTDAVRLGLSSRVPNSLTASRVALSRSW